MGFELDKRLANDTLPVADSEHYQLRLMNDQRYPWFVLIPTIAKITEWHQIPTPLRTNLFETSIKLGEAIQSAYNCKKINIATLGNMVSQLHVHIIGRQEDDPAWPAPVWGHSAAEPYTEASYQHRIDQLKQVPLPVVI